MNQEDVVDQPSRSLAGGGNMGMLMRSIDWSKTILGPVEGWSPTLHMMVGFTLANSSPHLLFWGPQLCQIYNDAYCPILGTKHSMALGQRADECWSEIWPILGPLIEAPLNGGPAAQLDNQLLELNRRGFVEEAYFTISYSPVPDDTASGGIGGVMASMHEITESILAERRSAVLRDLGLRTWEVRTVRDACAMAAETLGKHPKDVPFALLYLIDPDRQQARLAGSAGMPPGEAASPLIVALAHTAAPGVGWPLAEVVRDEAMLVVDDLPSRFSVMPPGPWPEPPISAVVVPVRSHTAHELAGLFVAGVSRRLSLDENYRSFFEIAATQIATTVSTARAHEDERDRAASLAEIAQNTAIATEQAHEDERTLAGSLAEIAKVTAIGTARAHEDERARARSLAKIAKATAIATAQAHEDERISAESLAEIAKATAVATARAREDERKRAKALAEIAKATATGTARAHEDERKRAEALAEIAKATAISTALAHEDERKSAESLAGIAKATAVATTRAHETERKAAEALAEIARATAIATERAHEDERKSAASLAELAKATAIATEQVHEEERKSAESLAEVAEARSAFFSDVSHEFRTPLTLILGPLEEILAKNELELGPDSRELVMVARRNGLRLLKLVNSLLEFSRIEAGRTEAFYEPVELECLTVELASNFRSACEKAGLALEIDCPVIGKPVFVDRDMWEKIVLNLLSNAFKFTFEGKIAVSLRNDGRHAILSVRDTGTGIAEHEIPRLFERFHRVELAQGRTDEGSGIGLALVQELVKLHAGTVRVASVHGEGSVFTISIPFGTAHLPADRIRGTSAHPSGAPGANPYIEEACGMLPDGAATGKALDVPYPIRLNPLPRPAEADDERAAVLVADDSADMRGYIGRLLSTRYKVRVVAHGEAALASIREDMPDLLLTDVMMPGLDGFGLLRAIRADPALADLPVMLLSARAGEEAAIEGLQSLADDYIVKPFSARELVARVDANLEMARLRCRRKQVETERRKLASTIEHAQDFIGLFDMELKTHNISEAGRRLLGLATIHDVRETDMRQCFAPEDVPRFNSDILPVIAAQGRWVGELAFRNFETGLRIPALHNMFPIHDPATGRQTHFGMIASDITQRRCAEDVLRKTQADVEAIVHEAPMGVFTVDGDLRFVHANAAASAAFDDIPDLIGRKLHEVIHGRWRKTYVDGIVKQFRHTLTIGNSYQIPEDTQGKHTEALRYYTWQISRVPLSDGSFGVVCYVRDLSAQVIARRAVVASERRLSDMTELMPQKVFSVAPNGRLSYFDKQWAEFTGLSLDQIRVCSWTQFMHPDQLPEHRSAWQRAMSTQEPFQFMHRFRRADGLYRLHLTRAQAMPGFDNEFTMWIGSSIDVQEQHEADEALRELTLNLDSKVTRRARLLEFERHEREIADASWHQAQKMEAIGQLTGGIAHDFNNILAAVLGNLELAHTGKLDPAIQRHLERAQEAAERGAKLTDHLLSFARKQPLRREVTGINPLIAKFCELIGRTLGPKVDVDLILADDLWNVIADAAQFEMALLNLALNARDAMPEGGTLTIETMNVAAGSLDLPGDLAPGDYTLVSVRDTGCGMGEAIAAKAFEPFYTTKTLGKGTGLGLSQVYGFSKQLGGTANLRSEPGVGTTVSFFLPRGQQVGPVASPLDIHIVEPPKSLGKRETRVLVIDDQVEVLEVIAETLVSMGFNVVQVGSGCAGLDILNGDGTVDLVVVDFSMPEMDGLEFIRRAHVSHPDLPCLLVTGYADLGKFTEAVSQGIPILRKPYRINALAAALDDLLARQTFGLAPDIEDQSMPLHAPGGATSPSVQECAIN